MQQGVSAKGILGKKRGRKECFLREGTAHGFRALHIYNIPADFELRLTNLKTKFDEIVNNQKEPPGETGGFLCEHSPIFLA